MLDIKFPVYGDSVPRNNAYMVFAGVSKALGGEHLPPQIGVFHLGGKLMGVDRIALRPYSRLAFRCPPEFIPQLLPLIGGTVEIGGVSVQLGSPHIEPVKTSPRMYAHAVYFRGNLRDDAFLRRAQYDLDRRGIKGTVSMPKHRFDAIKHLYQARVVLIKGLKFTAYSVLVDDLSPDDSSRLIAEGMGGRRHMGCGLFLPVRKEAALVAR